MSVIHHQYPVSVGRWYARGPRWCQPSPSGLYGEGYPVLAANSFSDRSSSYTCYRVSLMSAHGVSTVGLSHAGMLSFSFVNTDAKK